MCFFFYEINLAPISERRTAPRPIDADNVCDVMS